MSPAHLSVQTSGGADDKPKSAQSKRQSSTNELGATGKREESWAIEVGVQGMYVCFYVHVHNLRGRSDLYISIREQSLHALPTFGCQIEDLLFLNTATGPPDVRQF